MHRGLKRRVRACLLAGGALPPAAAVAYWHLLAPQTPGIYPPPARGGGALVATAGRTFRSRSCLIPFRSAGSRRARPLNVSFALSTQAPKRCGSSGPSRAAPCLTVGPVPVSIGPGEEKVLTVDYDPADDPEFSGRLSVEVTGLDEAGRAAFLRMLSSRSPRPSSARAGPGKEQEGGTMSLVAPSGLKSRH